VAADRYRRSREQHERARASLAGGVATVFRAGQLPLPITFVAGSGSRLRDIDGNEYIDYALAFGPTLLGHSPEPVITAVEEQLRRGVAYGASHPLEAELAEAVCRTVPCAERCVFSNSGSEAVHSAIRIARSFTGRRRVIKFLGHFHGWLDPLAIGQPGVPDRRAASAGQDPLASANVDVCEWNDVDALAAMLDDEVAAVIMEPLAVNGGCLRAAPGYLEAVREMTRRAGALLIFDEVITGFRLALGGAQERFGIVPDLVILGKALGGGFAISAVGGRADVMEEVASGRVRHAGTFNLNPISAAAALATINELERRASEIYPHLEAMGDLLASVMREEAAQVGLPLAVNQLGAAGYAFCSSEPVTDYRATLATDTEAYRRFAAALLDEGVHVISRGLLYVSAAHSREELEATRTAVAAAAARVATGAKAQPAAVGARL
jgi:glutamate-1-semialdehyde 2,1-aminomutase